MCTLSMSVLINTYTIVTLCDLFLFLGSFLNDAAWFEKAEKVFLACKEVCESLEPTLTNKVYLLKCCHK